MWSFTGADNQLWKWSESGNMLINVATGKPFAVGGFTEWSVARPQNGDILATQYGNKVSFNPLQCSLYYIWRKEAIASLISGS